LLGQCDLATAFVKNPCHDGMATEDLVQNNFPI